MSERKALQHAPCAKLAQSFLPGRKGKSTGESEAVDPNRGIIVLEKMSKRTEYRTLRIRPDEDSERTLYSTNAPRSRNRRQKQARKPTNASPTNEPNIPLLETILLDMVIANNSFEQRGTCMCFLRHETGSLSGFTSRRSSGSLKSLGSNKNSLQNLPKMLFQNHKL